VRTASDRIRTRGRYNLQGGYAAATPTTMAQSNTSRGPTRSWPTSPARSAPSDRRYARSPLRACAARRSIFLGFSPRVGVPATPTQRCQRGTQRYPVRQQRPRPPIGTPHTYRGRTRPSGGATVLSGWVWAVGDRCCADDRICVPTDKWAVFGLRRQPQHHAWHPVPRIHVRALAARHADHNGAQRGPPRQWRSLQRALAYTR
jgi:hypothetical protein